MSHCSHFISGFVILWHASGPVKDILNSIVVLLAIFLAAVNNSNTYVVIHLSVWLNVITIYQAFNFVR